VENLKRRHFRLVIHRIVIQML